MIAAILALSGGLFGVLALFAVGTVVYRIIVGKDEANDLALWIGFGPMVAGVFSEVVGNQGRWPTNTIVMAWRVGVPGANPGHLAADFVPATGTVTVTSSNALDVSTVAYMILLPG